MATDSTTPATGATISTQSAPAEHAADAGANPNMAQAPATTPAGTQVAAVGLAVDPAVDPTAVQLAQTEEDVLVVQEPAPGERVVYDVDPGQKVQFGFDLDDSQIRQVEGGVEVVAPLGGIVFLDGMSFDEFLVAIGGTPESSLQAAAGEGQGVPGAANEQASFRQFAEGSLLAALIANGVVDPTGLVYGAFAGLEDPLQPPENDSHNCLFTPLDDNVDFDTVRGNYAEDCFYHALEGDDFVLLPSTFADANLANYDPDHGFFGDQGDDTIVGRGLDDIVTGGNGDDSILGGANNDTLMGGGGDGEEGNDVIFDEDTLHGGNGDDSLVGGGTQGGSGNDIIFDEE